MFKWLSKLREIWRLMQDGYSPPSHPLPPLADHQRSKCDGERLTPEEERWMSTYGQCCDCGTGALWCGPQGGMSTNIACDNCGSEFSAILHYTGKDGYPTLFAGERISPPGPRDLGERGRLYGLPATRENERFMNQNHDDKSKKS
jgi:hypothetical protein